MLCVGFNLTLNIVFVNYIIKFFFFQVYPSKIFARMFQVQLRYFQYVLSLAILVGVILTEDALITACFVGLTLIWLTEMLLAQFDINTEKYWVVLILLMLSFLSVVSESIISPTKTIVLLLGFILASLTYFLIQTDINIYKVGNALMVLVVTFLVNGFFVGESFQENIYYVSYLYLLLLFLKTFATFLNIQFSNFQFFFNFFTVLIVFFGVSSFYDNVFLDNLLAATSTALFTTFITFMITKVRFEYELTTYLSTQIYIFDFLFAFTAALYFVDSINVVNGLF